MLFDLFGAFFSLLATYYFIKINKLAWLITLLATILNGYLYWNKGIYADMLLESFYFLSACYGWYLWNTKKLKAERPIIYNLSIKQWLLVFGFAASLYIIFSYLLKSYTGSDVVELDALTTALSLTAQALMTYKIIFTWILWLITDLLYAYLYFYKEIPFHAGLMILYLSMAIIGYVSWIKKRSLSPQSPQELIMNCKHR